MKKKNIQKASKATEKNFLVGVVAAVSVGIVGLVLVATWAAGIAASLEGEKNVLGNAFKVDDPGASAGSYVVFGRNDPNVPVDPTPPPTEPSPEPGGGNEAGTLFNWGTPVVVDNFDNLNNWNAYTSPGHAHGNRSPEQASIEDGKLVIRGEPGGKTAGLAHTHGQYLGRWEARMKAAGEQSCWRPVLLLWPDAEDFPVGGEIDYAERIETWDKVSFVLHYGANNSQERNDLAIDYMQYHNFAVEWTADSVTGWVDGREFFKSTNKAAIPPRSMHATAQLDQSPSCNGTTQMIVDWMKVYTL